MAMFTLSQQHRSISCKFYGSQVSTVCGKPCCFYSPQCISKHVVCFTAHMQWLAI